MKRTIFLLIITLVLCFAGGCYLSEQPPPANIYPNSHWKCKEVDIILHCNVEGDPSNWRGAN